MRRLTRSLLPLGFVLAAFALPAVAGEIYTWKDANGVTHYTDSPPPGRKHTTRKMAGPRPAAAKAVVNSDCSNARGNLELLRGEGKVGVDNDKDGKPDRELTAAERSSRLKLAETQVEKYCSVPTTTASR